MNTLLILNGTHHRHPDCTPICSFSHILGSSPITGLIRNKQRPIGPGMGEGEAFLISDDGIYEACTYYMMRNGECAHEDYSYYERKNGTLIKITEIELLKLLKNDENVAQICFHPDIECG